MKEKVVDRLGRIVIPKPLRKELGLTEGVAVCFSTDPEAGVLLVQKAKRVCMRCHGENDLIGIKPGFYLCSECLDSLNSETKRIPFL